MNEHEYGYYTPTDAKEGDECLGDANLHRTTFMKCPMAETGRVCASPQRRRRIEPGEGFEIVRLKEKVPESCEIFQIHDLKWESRYYGSLNRTMEEHIKINPHILAIRRPIQKQERVRYFQDRDKHVWKTGSSPLGYVWDGKWIETIFPPPLLEFAAQRKWPELTPDEAAAIIGRENVPECSPEPARPMTIQEQLDANKQKRLEEQSQLMHKVVGEEGDEKCRLNMGLSPAPEDTKGANFKSQQFSPIAFNPVPEPPTPNWIPVSQCDLKPGEALWVLYDDGVVRCCESGPLKLNERFRDLRVTHFMRALPPYAIPKPPVVTVEDDGFQEWWVNGWVNKTGTKDLCHQAWLASRASLAKEGR